MQADPDAPLTIIGTYTCHGWAGAIVIDRSGKPHSIPVTPEQAERLAKNAGVPLSNQIHVFPAQGDCAEPGDANKEWHDPGNQILDRKDTTTL